MRGGGSRWVLLAVLALVLAIAWVGGGLPGGRDLPWADDLPWGDAPRAGADGTASEGDRPDPGVWEVVSVTDGDTIVVRRDGVEERVRLLGIDTPEREQCGYAEARGLVADLVASGEVTLVVGSSDDRDRYGRLLRYVEVAYAGGTVDVGLRQLEAGLAAEVYDSRTGYAEHDREAAYIAADEAAPDVCPDLREH